MKKHFLDILACPECKSPLDVSILKEDQHREKEIVEGLLLCKACVKSFPIIEGIPRFVPNILGLYPEMIKKYPEMAKIFPEDDVSRFRKIHGDTQERFGMEWMKYPGSMEEDRHVFMNETQIPAGDWEGKRILDAGCGMGRYSRVAHSLGAAVVALDLSAAVTRLSDLAKDSGRLHLVQGNLMSPPFRKEVFDVVYSVGVIHHTPSAEKTFVEIAKLVKPSGLLSVWVYGTAGSFENFRTNPLSANRAGLKHFIFPVWLTVWVREKISDALRLFTVKTPHKLLYGFCYLLAGLGKLPLVKYLTFSVHPLWRVRLQENFDWLTPPYQSHHSKEELMGWFKDNGFEVLKVLPHGFVPKPGVLGKKR